MPSPFPGVDPYIEALGLWEGFHDWLVTFAADTLNESLPERYVAELGHRLRLVALPPEEGRQIVPDVVVGRKGRRAASAADRARGPSATALLEPIQVPLPRPVMTEIREVWIDIRRLPGRVPVTALEVLSPSNKTGAGFYEYQEKRRETTERKVHLVEFDLLLGGTRLDMARPLPEGDFYALVSRAPNRPISDVYTWTLRDPLPTIPIPLSGSDPDVFLDLATVFARAYERGRYGRLIDYSAPPSIVKKAADRAWAARVVRSRRR